jgi:hypothetical protein
MNVVKIVLRLNFFAAMWKALKAFHIAPKYRYTVWTLCHSVGEEVGEGNIQPNQTWDELQLLNCKKISPLPRAVHIVYQIRSWNFDVKAELCIDMKVY